MTVPGIGVATAAVLIAQAIDINRFATADRFVGYFGVFPEENTSGVDKFGNPLPPGSMHMSRKGNDLVRSYLWNAARAAIVHNPALGALYRRLKANGKRGDVALGHCMRKLLHLVYAVWKTNRPFDENHAAGETPSSAAGDAADAGSKETAVGHKRDVPAEEVVSTANATVAPTPPPVKAAMANRPARPQVDFAFLRQQVSMEQVLCHLGLFDQLRGRGQQRRGPCPIHAEPNDRQPTYSALLGKHILQCFQAACGAQGNVLDLWAAIHNLPLYEAALHLAETFHLRRNREEEPVSGTR